MTGDQIRDYFVEVGGWADGKGAALRNAEHLGIDNEGLIEIVAEAGHQVLMEREPLLGCISLGHMAFLAGVLAGREQKAEEDASTA